MKKKIGLVLATVLGLTAVCGMAACGEEEQNGENNGGNAAKNAYYAVKGEEVSKEEWDAAWQLFITADNASVVIDITSIEDPETDEPFYFYETQW